MCHNKNELRSVISEYRRLKSQESQIKSRINELQEQIFEYLEYNDVEPNEKITGQNYILSFSVCNGNKINKEKLSRIFSVLNIDISTCQEPYTYKRLNIK